MVQERSCNYLKWYEIAKASVQQGGFVMKALRLLLAVVMVLSFAIQPVVMDLAFAAGSSTVTGTSPGSKTTMPSYLKGWSSPASAISAATKITSATGTTDINKTGNLSTADQAEAQSILGVKPASAKTTGSGSAYTIRYYDAAGNLIGKKVVKSKRVSGAALGSDKATWYDKSGKVIATTNVVTKYTYKYFNGKKQVMSETIQTTSTRPDGSSLNTTTVKKYTRDAKGVVTGLSQQMTGTRVSISATGEKTTYTTQKKDGM
jgi:hypothetical protein